MKYIKIDPEETLKEIFKNMIKEFKPKNVYNYYDLEDKNYIFLEVTDQKEKQFYYKYNNYIYAVIDQKEFKKLNITDTDNLNCLLE